MKVCLVRHGETAWSLSGQHTGVTDLGLTTHGADESRSLAPRLRSLAFAQVLVLPAVPLPGRVAATTTLTDAGALALLLDDGQVVLAGPMAIAPSRR